MQAVLVKMERAGLAQRAAFSAHGCVQKTLLTPKGRDVLNQANQSVARSDVIARAAMAPHDRAEITTALLRFAAKNA